MVGWSSPQDKAMMETKWIAVDWGTSTLRAWLMGEDGQVLESLRSSSGMSLLRSHEFEGVLVRLLEPYLTHEVTPVLCCGMVGAREGWMETAYRLVPCQTDLIEHANVVETSDKRLKVWILPGLSQTSPSDIMRGEETQIAGYLMRSPDFFGTICLPGTHTKWAQVSAKEVVSFRTFLTGEMFEILTKHSILRFNLETDIWNEDAFLEAVNDALSAPQHFSSRLFKIRADTLLNEMCAATARARLSGYTIGLELAGARAYWLGQQLALIGESPLCTLYQNALREHGVTCRVHEGDEMVLEGLKSAYSNLKANIC